MRTRSAFTRARNCVSKARARRERPLVLKVYSTEELRTYPIRWRHQDTLRICGAVYEFPLESFRI